MEGHPTLEDIELTEIYWKDRGAAFDDPEEEEEDDES